MTTAAKKDEFDVLTFFIYVMALLTAIVGGFALWNWTKVDAVSVQIRGELARLEEMRKLAVDEELRQWIGREREGRGVQEVTAAEFQGFFINAARENQLQLTNNTLEGNIQLPDGTELPFRLIINDCRLENLVRFLVGIEEQVAGAKVKQIVQLNQDERSGGWDATIVLSIFRPNATP